MHIPERFTRSLVGMNGNCEDLSNLVDLVYYVYSLIESVVGPEQCLGRKKRTWVSFDRRKSSETFTWSHCMGLLLYTTEF